MTNQQSIVTQNVVNMYREPDSSSETISQAIFGSVVSVLDRTGDFCRIKTADTYEGWVLARWIIPAADTSDYVHSTIAPLFADVHECASHEARLVTRLTAGSPVVLNRSGGAPNYAALLLPDGRTAYTHIGNISLTYEPHSFSTEPPGDRIEQVILATPNHARAIEMLIENIGPVAQKLIGTPYLWGGTTPFGIDCSGFTQLVYRLNGILLLRDAALQRRDRRFAPVGGDGVPPSATAYAPGDLLFFGRRSPEFKVTHVGMALGDGTFIHAAGKGRGVIVTDCGDDEFASSYIDARRLSPDADFAIESA